MANVSNTIALAVASIFLAAIIGYVIWRGLAAVRRVGTFFLLFTVGMAFYGGSKGFWRSVNFPRTDLDVAYLTDNGSRVTSNAVHLAFSPAAILPSDAEIYLDYRDAESTNDADWVTYTNATLAAFPNPLDFEFENATNYSWMCYTPWTPGAAEVTNGVVRIGWLLPMDGATNTIVMLRTGVRYKSPLPYDAEVEYLESTGTQWIDTGRYPKDVGRWELTIQFTSLAQISGNDMLNGVYGAYNKRFDIGWRNSSNSWQLNIGAVTSVGTRDTDVHTFVLDNIRGVVSVDGQDTSVARVQFSDSTYPILIGNRKFYANPGMNYFCKEKIFSSRMYDFNNVLVRDFQPVRFTNEQGVSEAAMYDRANPTVGMNPDGSARTDGLYRNRGTGAFLYGADKTN